MATFGIPGSKVLRHADITHALSGAMVYWDGKSKSRKVDPSPDLWRINRTLWTEYQASLVPKAL